MALKPCPECQKDVSESAFKCPHCGKQLRKPKRGIFGKLSIWAFVLWNIFMIFALVSGMQGAGEVMQGAASEAEQAGAAIGTTLGVGVILVFWALGDIILGALAFFTRPKTA